MKYGKKRDANEKEIVAALIARGCSVHRLNEQGCPDLLVGHAGRNFLIEVKRPLGPKGGLPEQYDHKGGRGDLTRDQVDWFDAWRGDAVAIVRTEADVIALLALRESEAA